jgi:hypothetical protein
MNLQQTIAYRIGNMSGAERLALATILCRELATINAVEFTAMMQRELWRLENAPDAA